MIDTDCLRINYGLDKDPHELHAHWERGVPAGCALALKAACDQIDTDTALLRQALEALKTFDDVQPVNRKEIIATLRKRLEVSDIFN